MICNAKWEHKGITVPFQNEKSVGCKKAKDEGGLLCSLVSWYIKIKGRGYCKENIPNKEVVLNKNTGSYHNSKKPTALSL